MSKNMNRLSFFTRTFIQTVQGHRIPIETNYPNAIDYSTDHIVDHTLYKTYSLTTPPKQIGAERTEPTKPVSKL